jgi:hypothetical protein
MEMGLSKKYTVYAETAISWEKHELWTFFFLKDDF